MSLQKDAGHLRFDAYADVGRYERDSPGLAGDVAFYRSLAKIAEPPVLETGCGTGRVTLPVAREGIPIIGLDRAPAMLAAAHRRSAGVRNVDWVQSDMRRFAFSCRFGLIFIAYRGFQHLLSDADQHSCLRCVRSHLTAGGRFAFNIVNPDALSLSPRAGTPLISSADRGLRLRYVFADEMHGLLLSEGFEIEGLYGWFDGRPFNRRDSSEMVWIARRSAS